MIEKNSPLQTNKKRLRMAEELIVAILIGNSKPILKKGNSELHFKLQPNKHYILANYIKFNSVDITIYCVNEEENIYGLKHSIMLERILRDWTKDSKIVAVDSKYLTVPVFMLWICLFGESHGNAAVLIRDENISLQVAHTISYCFNENMESANVMFLSNKFHIGSLDEIFLFSLRSNRPSYETLEIAKLLPNSKTEGRLNALKRVAEGEILDAEN